MWFGHQTNAATAGSFSSRSLATTCTAWSGRRRPIFAGVDCLEHCGHRHTLVAGTNTLLPVHGLDDLRHLEGPAARAKRGKRAFAPVRPALQADHHHAVEVTV